MGIAFVQIILLTSSRIKELNLRQIVQQIASPIQLARFSYILLLIAYFTQQSVNANHLFNLDVLSLKQVMELTIEDANQRR